MAFLAEGVKEKLEGVVVIVKGTGGEKVGVATEEEEGSDGGGGILGTGVAAEEGGES